MVTTRQDSPSDNIPNFEQIISAEQPASVSKTMATVLYVLWSPSVQGFDAISGTAVGALDWYPRFSTSEFAASSSTAHFDLFFPRRLAPDKTCSMCHEKLFSIAGCCLGTTEREKPNSF